MKKIGLFIFFMVLVWGVSRYGAAQAPISTETTDSGQYFPRYYIFVDNSESMKSKRYYERVLSIIYERSDGEFHFIPFGSTEIADLKDFTSYPEFLEYLGSRDFYYTDFERLGEFITANVKQGDDIIIITDGEHDIECLPPSTQLTESEIEAMNRVVQNLENYKNNITVVHLLKNSPGASDEITIKIDTDGPITDRNVIKALTHDFLKRLTDGSDNYHFCKNRRETIQALYEKIFNLSGPIACDMSNFSTRIPLKLTSEYVPSRIREKFRQKLLLGGLCFNGIQRELIVLSGDNEDHGFPVEMDWVADVFYTIRVNGAEVWKEDKLDIDSDFERASQKVKDHFKEKIGEAEIHNNNKLGGFVEPHCQISIRFAGDGIYPFLSEANFKVFSTDCSGEPVEMENLRFSVQGSVYTKRFYIEIPMVSTRKIAVTYPHDPNRVAWEVGLNPEEIRRIVEGDELEVKEAVHNIPVVNYNFNSYLNDHKGEILLFSAATKRYAGKIQDPGYFRFYKTMKYWFFHVPEDLERDIVTFSTRLINSADDVREALNLLDLSRHKAITHWKDCLEIFNNAEASGNKANISEAMKRLVDSNGFLQLLLHLDEITAIGNEPYKKSLIRILEVFHDRYGGGSARPFRIIELIKKVEVPGISKKLKTRYLELGDPIKMNIVIAILSNPINNLQKLRFYLLGESDKVDKQNSQYFRILQGVE